MTTARIHSLPAHFGEILRRIAVPLLVFAAVLAGLLALSWRLLIPTYTTFEVEGALVPVQGLAAFEKRIEDDIAAALARREELVLPTQDRAYVALLDGRHERRSPLDEEAALRALAAELGLGDALVLSHIHVAQDGLLSVDGDVRGVGPRSMTDLARFIDALAADPEIAGLTPPAFVREEDPVVGFRSPFAITYRRFPTVTLP